MSKDKIVIPKLSELIAQASKFNYTVSQPEKTHTHVNLQLDSNHPVVPILAQYALVISAGLEVWDSHIDHEKIKRPDFTDIKFQQLRKNIKYLEQKPCKHYRGWIGEIVTHFLLHHFIIRNRDLLNYSWEAIQPPKTEVTGGELDIVAVYELKSEQLGHICGEVKTYEKLSQAKSDAYFDLHKARDWSHNRDAQIRRALNILLQPRFEIGSLQAANLAMGNERSFLPGLIHSISTQFKKKLTFDDLPQQFDSCTRPSQLIGIQIVISDFGGSCNANPLQSGFFENFLQCMRLQAIIWKNPERVSLYV